MRTQRARASHPRPQDNPTSLEGCWVRLEEERKLQEGQMDWEAGSYRHWDNKMVHQESGNLRQSLLSLGKLLNLFLVGLRNVPALSLADPPA